MVRNQTAFSDPAVEIQELTTTIANDIKAINEQISILQTKTGRKNKQSDVHTNTVVESLKYRIKTTTKDFSQALETRNEVFFPSSKS